MSEMIPCLSTLLSGKLLYTCESSFNISIGFLSFAPSEVIVSSSTPRLWHLDSTFFKDSSSIISPSNSPLTCCKFNKIDLNARPISEPLRLVVAIIVASAAVSSSIWTPASAAYEALTRTPSAISVSVALFLLEI